MSKISRRTALGRGGQAVAIATVFPLACVSAKADATEGDAVLLDLEAQVLRLIDEVNAGLHSSKGDVTAEAMAHEEDLEAAIARHPARTLEGVAVKLRRQRYWIEDICCQDAVFLESALADLQRLSGRVT